jgi:arsenate reductase
MAEGFTRAIKGNEIEAFSAGIETHGLNPNAVKVMKEAGVDISSHKSQNINKFKDKTFDYVVTVCGHAHETCPFFPGNSKVVHVGFDDPPKLALEFDGEEEKLNCYRKVRDQIKEFVLKLPENLENM